MNKIFFIPAKRWWVIFLRKSFNHCCFIEEVGNKFKCSEKCNDGVSCDLITNEEYKYFDKYPMVVTSRKVKYYPVNAITCVQYLKKLLGIKNIFVFTPYQLYKFLKKETVYGRR